MTPIDSRSRLAALQQELVSALTDKCPPPPGFDAVRIRIAAESLSRKRMQAVAKAWPELARSLGAEFSERFTHYAAMHSLPRQGGALADGRRFAQQVCDSVRLGDMARLEMLAVDVHYVRSADGLRPRRGPVLRCLFLRESRCLVIAGHLPVVGEFHFRLHR
jgi:hypothetical protein